MIRHLHMGRCTFIFRGDPRPLMHKRGLQSVPGTRSTVSGIVATVFGATGFTGQYVVERLARIGAQIILPFRGEESSYKEIKPVGDLGQIVPLRIELKDKETIKRTVMHSNVVINLIGRAWETRNYKYRDVNVTGAIAIAEASRHADRFIHISAAEVDPASPSAWARSKAEGEAAVRDILPHATILRPTAMFGDEDRLIRKWGVAAAKSRYLPICHGDAKIQPLYGIDLAKCVVAALADPDSSGKVYTLGGPKVYTWEELIDKILVGAKRETRKKIHVSENVMDKICAVLENGRYPNWVRGEVKHYYQDIP